MLVRVLARGSVCDGQAQIADSVARLIRRHAYVVARVACPRPAVQLRSLLQEPQHIPEGVNHLEPGA
jgi:hypothetical protein